MYYLNKTLETDVKSFKQSYWLPKSTTTTENDIEFESLKTKMNIMLQLNTWFDYIRHSAVVFTSHESKHCENHEARVQTGATICQCKEDAIPNKWWIKHKKNILNYRNWNSQIHSMK